MPNKPATAISNRSSKLACILLTALCLLFPVSALGQLSTTSVYIGNQGNFSDANGSVSMYTPSTTTVVADGLPDLNTLVQSITLHENTGFVMANTSDRIDIFDLPTNTRTGQILDVPSPRYMAAVSDDKAYVSNLFSSSVTVIDLTSNTVAGTISAGTNPEDIAAVAGYAFVANNGFGFDSTLTRIDIATDAVVDTLQLGCDGPRSLEVDAEDELWVVCNGKTEYNSDFTEILEQTNGQVLVVDPATKEIKERLNIDTQVGASSAGQDTYYDGVNNVLYLVRGSELLAFDTTTNTQAPSIAIAGSESLGGVAFDAASGHLYLARITSFTTAGFVSVHTPDGTEVSRFDVGIAPTSIALWQTGTSVATEDPPGETPQRFTLNQNYPNPFNPSTTITFELTHATDVSLKVYSLLGIEVATLTDRAYQAGSHKVDWQATDLPSGRYFYTLQAGDVVATRQMTLIK
ncbi:MAG: DUF5074 domain-containing protein [Bacteroidota bacterium]